jgi:hypothetical protein
MNNFTQMLQQNQNNVAAQVIAALNDPNGILAQLRTEMRSLTTEMRTATRLLTGLSRRQLISENKVKYFEEPLNVIPGANGTMPPHTIHTRADLLALNDAETTEMCRFYGINPVPTIVTERYRGIAREIGLPAAWFL